MAHDPPPYTPSDGGKQQLLDGKTRSAYDPSLINQPPQPGMREYSYNQGSSSGYGAPQETHWESTGGIAQHSAGSYKPVQPPPQQFQSAPPQGSMVPVGQHQYRGPRGDIITTHLPPDHPEMQCLQKGHKSKTEFGLVGVVCGIVFFPIGCVATAIDRRVVCKRCGLVMDQGVFSR